MFFQLIIAVMQVNMRLTAEDKPILHYGINYTLRNSEKAGLCVITFQAMQSLVSYAGGRELLAIE